jgi:hypothetical protein
MTFSRNSVVACILPAPCTPRRLGVERGRVDVHARAGLHDVDDDQPDDERERAHDLEIEQREPPVLPTFFMSSMPAMPTTTVQKMIGAMSILMSLMKPSPSGFIFTPRSG